MLRTGRTYTRSHAFDISFYEGETTVKATFRLGTVQVEDHDGQLIVKDGDHTLYAVPLSKLDQVGATIAFGGAKLLAGLSGPSKTVNGVEIQSTIKPYGDVEITTTYHGVENTISFNAVTGEIAIDTSAVEHVHGQSGALSISTTLTPRRELKRPASQPAKQVVRRTVPATEHAPATEPSRILAEHKANKPSSTNPIFGLVPPTGVPAPGFALADDNAETLEYGLMYTIEQVVAFFAEDS
jgi:hypothetical protein